ncbi:hypothetical protein F4604DRAFT_1746488 [Suillus subluteus]|nr:hypothetical protein F4604DRAFT_1746488 [Suillus subluteus]
MQQGCRSIISQISLAAVVYAQTKFDEETRNDLSDLDIYASNLLVAISDQLQIPPTWFTCDQQSYVFEGCLDYSVRFTHPRRNGWLFHGCTKLKLSDVLSVFKSSRVGLAWKMQKRGLKYKFWLSWSRRQCLIAIRFSVYVAQASRYWLCSDMGVMTIRPRV